MTDVPTPFRYPKDKHFRRLRPGPFARYQSYKPALRQEFEQKCVYCRAPDGPKGLDGFGVDHYRPKSLFPTLRTTYTNLFYCCNQCNRRKGSHWPANPKARIPNPCDHEMHKHLRFASERVEGRTSQGNEALEVLDLNDPDAILMRKMVNGTLRGQQQLLGQIHVKITALERLQVLGVAEAIEQLRASAAEIQEQMNWFLGR